MRPLRCTPFFVLFFSLIAPLGFAEPARLALVIGNAAYEGVPALKNPINDANDIAGNLSEIGWTVTKLTDANKVIMQRTIKKFRDQALAAKDCTLLVYYSGHGVQIRDKNYLIPTKFDADPENEEELADLSVPVDYLTDALSEVSAKVTILILDACRDNPFLKSKGTRSVGAATRGLVAVDLKASETQTAVIFSTAPGTTASDGTGRNGVFTEAFLKHIKEPDQLTDLMNKVTSDVQKATKGVQKPFTSYNMSASFYLLSETERNSRAEAIKKQEDAAKKAEIEQALAAERAKLAKEKADLQAQLQAQLARAQQDAEASRSQLAAERARAQAEADAAKKSADDAQKAALAAQAAYDKAVANGSSADKASAEALQKQVQQTQKALADAEAAKTATSDVLAAADARTRQAQAEAEAAKKAAADAVAAADFKTQQALADAESARKAVTEAQALNQALKEALARGAASLTRLSFSDLPINVEVMRSGEDVIVPNWLTSGDGYYDGVVPNVPVTLKFYSSMYEQEPNRVLVFTPTSDETKVTIPGGFLRLPWVPDGAALELEGNNNQIALDSPSGFLMTEDGPRLTPKLLEGKYQAHVVWRGRTSPNLEAVVEPNATTEILGFTDFFSGLLQENLTQARANLAQQQGQAAAGWTYLVAGTLLGAASVGTYVYGVPVYQQYRTAHTTAQADSARSQLELLGNVWPALAGVAGFSLVLGTTSLAFNLTDDFGAEIRDLVKRLANLRSVEAGE